MSPGQADRFPKVDAERRQDVELALADVLDPELDEPLIDLGFIDNLRIDGDAVRIQLRLPTFWCSANFVYIMGEDMIAALNNVPWLSSIRIELVDHFAAKKINDGLAKGLSFQEVFGAEAADGLDAIRVTFRDKSYLSRQAKVIQALRREKEPADAIVAMTIADLQRRTDMADRSSAKEVRRYLEALRLRSETAANNQSLAFVDLDGLAIPANRLLDYLRETRKICGSVEANAEMCRILFAARYGGHTDKKETSDVVA